MKCIKIKNDKIDSKNTEGIFLVNPQWIHLDEKEIKERLGRGEKLFKVEVSL